tara:strand:+ start:409 stop:780 length:372 start_codon:yes stop_codon:yes gene_type:complete
MVRNTRQRRAILQALAHSARPLRVSEILELGQKHVSSLGQTTVYRNLREMLKEGSIIRVEYPGQPPLYELPSGKVLPHFICKGCHQVYYFEHEAPAVSYEFPDGFIIEAQEVIFYGHCPDCAP